MRNKKQTPNTSRAIRTYSHTQAKHCTIAISGHESVTAPAAGRSRTGYVAYRVRFEGVRLINFLPCTCPSQETRITEHRSTLSPPSHLSFPVITYLTTFIAHALRTRLLLLLPSSFPFGNSIVNATLRLAQHKILQRRDLNHPFVNHPLNQHSRHWDMHEILSPLQSIL